MRVHYRHMHGDVRERKQSRDSKHSKNLDSHTLEEGSIPYRNIACRAPNYIMSPFVNSDYYYILDGMVKILLYM